MIQRNPAAYTVRHCRPPLGPIVGLVVFAFVLTSLGLYGSEPAETSAEDLQFFEKRIRPILVERCFECHSAAAPKLKGGLQLDTRAAILSGGDSGPAALPGIPMESLLIRTVNYNADIQMPPAGKLPDAEIALLTEWIERGLPFPSEAVPLANRTGDWTARRQHWSFQPLRAAAPAPVVEPFRAWVQNRVDAYVSREWTTRGLSTSGEADRRALLRRLSFDLAGLPPALEDQTEFMREIGPDEPERAVDRQLASPRYGERWGRHWLDLARYCDIPESWRESTAKAWLYRDWVVRALNRDLPYDQFVRQQLAADLQADHDPVENAALGFLGLSPSYWKELKLDQLVIKQVVAEEWEERIEALGATFLGLTLACARCHDHKFDPITMHDYYGLAGVMASSRLEDVPTFPAAEARIAREALERGKKLQEEIDKLAATKPLTEEIQRQIDEQRAELSRVKQTPYYDASWVYGVSESSLHVVPDGPNRTRLEYHENEPQDVALQIRGNPGNTGPVIPRRFLSQFSFVAGAEPQVGTEEELRFRVGSGRLELADALVTRAAPLSARIIVNRIWKQHFGRGLVTTPSNFGTQGDPPSHPELLDDLARRYLEQGWSTKRLHRELLLSATYRQAARISSTIDSSAVMVRGRDQDPDNIWLWRSPIRRLDLEAWRDTLLSTSGELDLQLGGPAIALSDAANHRRTVYGQVKRRELADIQRLHDFPDPVAHAAAREPTTTSLQQLFVLNSPFMAQQSQLLAQRLTAAAGQERSEIIEQAYLVALGRAPTADEKQVALEYIGPHDFELVRQFLHALLASNEFQFID